MGFSKVRGSWINEFSSPGERNINFPAWYVEMAILQLSLNNNSGICGVYTQLKGARDFFDSMLLIELFWSIWINFSQSIFLMYSK
jgi:hypothetical protein